MLFDLLFGSSNLVRYVYAQSWYVCATGQSSDPVINAIQMNLFDFIYVCRTLSENDHISCIKWFVPATCTAAIDG